MPKVIKRYGNRKLYDTSLSRYVTLEEIGQMIKDGEEVKVVDNRTKEDLTSVTLAQIILEEEKQKKGILPLSVLRDLIQQGGESISEFLQRSLHSFSTMKDETEKQVQKLINRGEITIEEGQALLREWFQTPQRSIDMLHKKLDERFRPSVKKLIGLSMLQERVEGMEKELKKLEKKLQSLKKEI